MTTPLSDALRLVASGGHVPDERGLFAAAAHMVDQLDAQLDRLVDDLGRAKGLRFAQSQTAHISPLAAQAADVGACGANGVDQAVGPVEPELGGQRAMWRFGGGLL